MDIAELKTCAIAGAARFSSVWEFDDFWKRSNTFHGFLRFVDAVEQKWGKSGDDLKPMRDLRSEMIAKNGPYFDRAIGGDGVWADDYGWCGISCLAAQDYLRSIGDDSAADMYLDRAERCWQWMTQTGYDGTDAATPVKHGCGNTSPERRKASGTYGTRNTVTNVNLLLLSLRLYAATKKSDYLLMAWSQYQWFSAWMTIEYKSLDDGRYVRQIGLGPTYALIHERPMAEDTYVETSDPGWERGWLWSGDQGLLMAAMAEVVLMQNDFRQFPGFDPAFARDKCNYIAAGIEHYLFGKDAVLREAPFRAAFNPPPPNVNYANDYVGGRGVLLRYASEASVRQARKTTFNLDGARKTAAAVWDSRVSPNQFTPLWNSAGDAAFNAGFVAAWGTGVSTALTWKIDAAQLAGVLQANGLDAITAAIRAS